VTGRRMQLGGLAVAAAWGGLAVLALYAPEAAAALLAFLGLCTLLPLALLALLAVLGRRRAPDAALLGKLAPVDGWAPPRNPDRAAAAYESYTIPTPARYDPRLRNWE
jgi:hypothetical protein